MTDQSNRVDESLLPTGLSSNAYSLTVRQGPERAKAFLGPKEKDRKPVDPPPIIQLQIRDPADPAQNYLQSPYFFMCCNLCNSDRDQLSVAEQGESLEKASASALAGTLVSSLHRLKDVDNLDGGFFVFPDVSVRIEGQFRLKFSLFEMLKAVPKVVYIKSIISEPFTVFAPRTFPGMSESTFLSRSFGDQGVKLRIRKEPRILGKRSAPSDVPHPNPYQPFPPNYRGMAIQPQPETSGDFGSSAYRDSGFGYDDPSPKRQRMSVDLGRAHEANQRSTYSSSLQQRDHYQNSFRDAPMSSRVSYHSQGQSSAPGSVSEFSFGHQRTNSSSTSSPFTGPRNENPNGYVPALAFQPSSRDINFQYPYNQYASAQARPSSRFSQPAPVPPDRCLPSSGQPQPDSLRSHVLLQEDHGSLPSVSRYSDMTQVNVPEYQQAQAYASHYESIGQPTARTLPPPMQISTSLLPPLTSFSVPPYHTNNDGAGTESSQYAPSFFSGAGTQGSAASSHRSGPIG